MVYPVIGLMSGTSLDGLDVVMCEFEKHDPDWSFSICYAESVEFPNDIGELLRIAHTLPSDQLVQLDRLFAAWCGQLIRSRIADQSFPAMLAGSHGHTVFHDPASGYTLQIGSGEVMAKVAGIMVVSDFRSGDIALGGEGAPLVPAGERLLFTEYSTCLNLGGIANVAFHDTDRTTAFDICPVNQLLNQLSARTGRPYDPEGSLASRGQLITKVLEQLNRIPYYETGPPKSLSREMVDALWIPLLSEVETPEDLLHTCSIHIAQQISSVLNKNTGNQILVTGGGAFNQFLIETLQSMLVDPLHLPSNQIIQYKEALIFGFLGLLRYLGEPNVLGSATGAMKDHCSGTLSLP